MHCVCIIHVMASLLYIMCYLVMVKYKLLYISLYIIHCVVYALDDLSQTVHDLLVIAVGVLSIFPMRCPVFIMEYSIVYDIMLGFICLPIPGFMFDCLALFSLCSNT